MSADEERRKRERKAKVEAETTGVAEADLQRDAARALRYGDPYDALVGKWVLVQGVREHYRGLLTCVMHFAGGARLIFEGGVYHLDDFNQDSPALGDGGQKLEGPVILVESGALVVCPQPSKWPKS